VLGALALIVVVRLVTHTGERLRRDAVRQRVLYEDEKRIADALQQAFLQRTLPDVASIDMHAVYIPAGRQAQVGGDWYEAMQLPDGRIFVSVGDVSGHGVEAAVSMTRARQTLTTLATLGRSPSEILEHVNRTLIVQGQAMVTAICCFIDPQTLEIEYASAGHPPAVIVEPNGGAHFLEPQGIPLGVVDHATYSSYLLSPPAGSLIVLYTDGLVEYDHDLIAGERRLLKAVAQIASSGAPDPAGALRDAIFAKRAPVDDVAVVTLRMGGPQSGRAAQGAARERMGHARKTRAGGRR
jgi:serine phosphatase RsbU (regulator of sigma subunit)